MNKKYLLLLIIPAFILFMVMNSIDDAGTYDSFENAKKHEGAEFHIVGKLVNPEMMEYNPKENANQFVFFLEDEKGTVSKVILNEPKPAQFENNEKIVVIGKMEGEEFKASKMLTKCPSKYEDDKLDSTADING